MNDLEAHPAIERVIYPGLVSHPQKDRVARQMDLPGGMMTFQLRGNPDDVAKALANRLKIVHYAFSLGHQRSIVVLVKTDHMMASTFNLEAAQRADYEAYADKAVFRLSIGLESPKDLIEDFEH